MNCMVSGGYSTAINKEESIAMHLMNKGIYEEGNYSILPLKTGEWNLFTVKYRNSSVNPVFDDLHKAIREFLKLTEKD